MSCVILTKTQIAFDHGVVNITFPHTTVVDPDHKKVFVDPDKRFIIAFSGTVEPQIFAIPETSTLVWRFIERINKEYLITGALSILVEGEIATTLQPVFGNNQFLLITDRLRLYVKGKTDDEVYTITVKEAGELCGLGTGGMYGVGLVEGGWAFPEVFPAIHRFDSFTSDLFSVISLNVLQPIETDAQTEDVPAC